MSSTKVQGPYAKKLSSFSHVLLAQCYGRHFLDVFQGIHSFTKFSFLLTSNTSGECREEKENEGDERDPGG